MRTFISVQTEVVSDRNGEKWEEIALRGMGFLQRDRVLAGQPVGYSSEISHLLLK